MYKREKYVYYRGASNLKNDAEALGFSKTRVIYIIQAIWLGGEFFIAISTCNIRRRAKSGKGYEGNDERAL